jgi:hypothetical protein
MGLVSKSFLFLKTNRKGRLTYSILIFIFFLLFFLLPGQHLHFDAIDVSGNIVKVPDGESVHLLLFLDPLKTSHKRILAYAQVVYTKYESKQFKVFAICTRRKEISRQIFNYGRFTIPFIPDNEKKIHDVFNIPDCCGGTVLLDKSGRVKFISKTLLNSENLRQLTEKNILGKINYDFQPPKKGDLFKLNHLFPDLDIREVTSNSPIALDSQRGEYFIITFFSSLCNSCKTGRRIITLKSLDKRIKDKGAQVITLVAFFKPYDRKDIEGWDKEIQIPFEKFIAEDIYTNEEKYINDENLVLDPFTVLVNNNKNIVFIEKNGMSERDIFSGILTIIKRKAK